jgi:hypothetical protein
MLKVTTRTMALAITGVLALAVAGEAAASVDGRQRHQARRIHAGVESGALSRREAARLRAEQAAIRAEERRYRRDGVLGPWDRADLNRDINRAGRDIRRQKHDGRRL